MRRSLGLVVGGIGAVGAALFLRGRRALVRPQEDPAEALRRRLALARDEAPAAPAPRPEARELRPEPDPASMAGPRPAAESRREDVESRRAEVHSRARARVEEMRGEPPAEP